VAGGLTHVRYRYAVVRLPRKHRKGLRIERKSFHVQRKEEENVFGGRRENVQIGIGKSLYEGEVYMPKGRESLGQGVT
jgi:hypothetical protein